MIPATQPLAPLCQIALVAWVVLLSPTKGQEQNQDILSIPDESAQTTIEVSTADSAPSPESNAVASTDKTGKIKKEGAVSLASEITKSCKEREKRMLAIHEAMLKLREAGDEEESNRLEARLRAMVETRDPREDDALVANKAELLLLKRTVLDMTAEVMNLRTVLEQNNRIIDEILKKAVPDVSSAVIEEMKSQARKPEIRKVP